MRGSKPIPIERRFFKLVDTSGDCWHWLGRDRIRAAGRRRNARAVSYELAHGLPIGTLPHATILRIVTTCGTDDCVKPEHLLIETEELRFWRSVIKTETCWLWPVTKAYRWCYGTFVTDDGTKIKAHRFALRLATGSMPPPDAVVCHRCDNPRCVRPEHLFLGTQLDNIHDGMSKGRIIWRGERNNAAKLTECDVREIRRRRAAGEMLKSIAETFGIATSTASIIVSRRRWPHVI